VRVRGTVPRSITAWVTSEADTWVIEHTLFASEESLALLHRQLERLPCVTAVQHSLAGPEASPTLNTDCYEVTISAEFIKINSSSAREEQLERPTGNFGHLPCSPDRRDSPYPVQHSFDTTQLPDKVPAGMN
jgi:hypothetical protein